MKKLLEENETFNANCSSKNPAKNVHKCKHEYQ